MGTAPAEWMPLRSADDYAERKIELLLNSRVQSLDLKLRNVQLEGGRKIDFDALLLATMPYNSINEREIGTTFGLRAQDAIGWNPRSFRFIASPGDFQEARQLFRLITANTGLASATGTGDPKQSDRQATARLLEMVKHAATGEFRIVDAHIVPGVADPAQYAQTWAAPSSRTPHTIEEAPGGKSGALGALKWMRFAVTLWLPAGWVVPASVHGQRMACPD